MSRFYISARGSRGEVTRTGQPSSGVHAHVRGWDCGVIVDGFVNADGEDCFEVYLTGGSNDPHRRELIASVPSSVRTNEVASYLAAR